MSAYPDLLFCQQGPTLRAQLQQHHLGSDPGDESLRIQAGLLADVGSAQHVVRSGLAPRVFWRAVLQLGKWLWQRSLGSRVRGGWGWAVGHGGRLRPRGLSREDSCGRRKTQPTPDLGSLPR